MDELKRILLTKYDPSNPALSEGATSLPKSQALQGQGQLATTPPEALRSVLHKSATGTTTTMTVVMSSDDYTDDEITFGCMAFNLLNPTSMSKSYQLPVAFEGIPAGSWVYVTSHKGQ